MIAWVDLETTGLEVASNRILEIALVVTTDDLDYLAGASYVVKPYAMPAMPAVVREMHTANGLLDAINNDEAVGTRHAELRLTAMLDKVAGWEDGKAPLGGASVGFDRKFLAEYMPRLEAKFHYRNIDVSTVKELVERWCPGRRFPGDGNKAHRALDDIEESIGLARYYRQAIFAPHNKENTR